MITEATRLQTVEEYYFSRKLNEVREMISAGKPVVNIGIGSPDMHPSEEVLQALTSAVHEDKAHQYQSYRGLPELREAIGRFYNRFYKVAVDPETEVLPLMGSKEGIMHISMAFLNPGDRALIPDPGYPTYASVTRLAGGEPLFYDLTEDNEWFPDLQALEEQDLSRVKLMWLSYPHMPTGATAGKEKFEALVAFAKKHSILLINDNPYSFVLNNDPLSILETPGAEDVALELNSLSKTFNMAGWRVGFLLGKSTLIQSVLKVKSNMDSGMFYGIQKGAVKALELSSQWYADLNRMYTERRHKVYELAATLGCTFDPEASGMFVWAKLPENAGTSEEFVDHLLYEKHIFVTPGTVFGKNGEGYIRFSLCVDTDTLDEVLNRFVQKRQAV